MKFFEYLSKKREIKLKIFEREQEMISNADRALLERQEKCDHDFEMWRREYSTYGICKKCLFKKEIL